MVQQFVSHSITLTDEQFISADVNGDGEVTVVDVNLIQQYVSRIINQFPVEV